MAFTYLLSWFINFLFISIVLALMDKHKNYYLEKKPWFTFTVALLFPTFLELACFLVEGKPFLALLLPDKFWGWLFG